MIRKINTNRHIGLLIPLYKLNQFIIRFRCQFDYRYMDQIDLLIVQSIIDVLSNQADICT